MTCPKCGHDEYVSETTGQTTCVTEYAQCRILPRPVEAERNPNDPLLRMHKMRPSIHGRNTRLGDTARDVIGFSIGRGWMREHTLCNLPSCITNHQCSFRLPQRDL